MAAVSDVATIEVGGRPVDRARLAAVCRKYRVVELSVFGSVARGDADETSDVDLLYVLEADARLGFAINRLEDELVEVFGRPVDLVAKRALHHLLRDDVLADAHLLYAA
jgi:predicted nucleotidyltransferase